MRSKAQPAGRVATIGVVPPPAGNEALVLKQNALPSFTALQSSLA
jgi:hypothetical protein